MVKARVFQICYDQATRAALDPGFEVLDNRGNERPDWWEYWPMRRFLLDTSLEEDCLYGFLSPKFGQKTQLDSAAVMRFLAGCDAGTEVALFSPSIHASAYFQNVFQHGEDGHPGLLGVTQRFLARIGSPVLLDEVISDSTNTVFANYFIARPRFWRAWLALNERLFAIAEDRSDAMGAELRAGTSYAGRGDVHMKIFIMERLASLLLATDRSYITRVCDPFAAPSRLYKLPLAVACDALKIAYRAQGHAQYLEVFRLLARLRGFINAPIRLGMRLGLGPLGRARDELAAHWVRRDEPPRR